MRKIELLSPARNAEIGIEAIKHGADAVYIGGPKFGARAAAGNSIADIKRLCDYAHTFGAKVYVTLNTILYDEELPMVQKFINELYLIGVDALIVQDLGVTQLELPPIDLHASTQLDITTPEKAQMLQAIGFKQIVLARELSLNQIKDIHEACEGLPLEAFIHGALCVSYSGRCYASQHCFNRSANRGECAQFCRLPFEVRDANNNVVRTQCHPLSLRDMNRSTSIEEMLDAGITSFKIEGRLKDMTYVKNITAYYRQQIDNIISRRPNDFERASKGVVTIGFTPQPYKSFNRGFTEYFLHGKRKHEASIETPKSKGEFIGTIYQINQNGMGIALTKGIELHAGDGLCFMDFEGTLQGCRANKVLLNPRTNRADIDFGPNTPEWFRKMASLPRSIVQKIRIFRNADTEFDKLLSKPTATRKLKVDFTLTLSENGIQLRARDELKRTSQCLITQDLEKAREPQQANIIRQLMKLGDTPYYIGEINLPTEVAQFFIPSSLLTAARREAIEQLSLSQATPHPTPLKESPLQLDDIKLNAKVTYTGNVSNAEAKAFYETIGATAIEPAYECKQPHYRCPIMFCKYCLRHELGICVGQSNSRAHLPENSLFLHSKDGQVFELKFNCKKCEMEVWPL